MEARCDQQQPDGDETGGDREPARERGAVPAEDVEARKPSIRYETGFQVATA